MESSAVLCLYNPDIDIANITSLVGSPPSRTQRRGDRRRPSSPPARIGLWGLEAPSTLGFDDKVRFLLEKTTSNPKVWLTLSQTHDIQLRCVIYLHSWNEGFELDAGIVSELGTRRWAFGLSIYSAMGGEIVTDFLSGQPLPIPPPHQ